MHCLHSLLALIVVTLLGCTENGVQPLPVAPGKEMPKKPEAAPKAIDKPKKPPVSVDQAPIGRS